MEDILATGGFDKQIFDASGFYHEKLFTIPLTEVDVLDLQAMFVTPGVHIITMKNIHEGRLIIQTILKSLKYYHTIACVSETENIAAEIYDVIGHIKFQQQQKENLAADLEEFFAIHPWFDFVWIECAQALQQSCSIEDIKKIFYMYHAEERMPVICVKYEEEDKK